MDIYVYKIPDKTSCLLSYMKLWVVLWNTIVHLYDHPFRVNRQSQIVYWIYACIKASNFQFTLYRGSYMSAHVLLNLLNELGKRDKMRGLPSILTLFCNELNKFNKTRARMLDSIYHMALRLLWNLISAIKTLYFVIMYATLLWT